MYFGYFGWNATYVLKKKEDSEQLEVAREDEALDLWRGFDNTASCVFKAESYSVKTNRYREVYRYSLKAGKWSQYY